MGYTSFLAFSMINAQIQFFQRAPKGSPPQGLPMAPPPMGRISWLGFLLNSTCRQRQLHRSSNSNIAATAAALQHHCCNAALQQHHRSIAAAALQQQQHCRCWQCLHCLLCLHWMLGLPCLYCFFGLLLLCWLHLLPCLGSIARFIWWVPLLFSQGGLLHRRPPPPIDFLMCSRALFPCLVLVMGGGPWTPSIEGFILFSACFCFHLAPCMHQCHVFLPVANIGHRFGTLKRRGLFFFLENAFHGGVF